jgi:DNA-binding beta-propeller fold protein YncE
MPGNDYAESKLRDLLRDQAWSLPSWPDAPSRVRRAARRQRLRVAGLTASLGAVVVAAVVVPAIQLSGGGPQPLGPAGPPAAYVLTSENFAALESDDAVTPINLATDRAGRPISIPGATQEIPAPDGRAVYVNGTSGVTVISTVTNRVARAIRLGPAGQMALAPDGKTLFVISGPLVIPVSTVTGRAGRPVRIGRPNPQWIVISRDGRTAYVTAQHSHKAFPIQIATDRALTPIDLGGQPTNSPGRIVTAPTGHLAYFSMKNQITPVDTSTNTALKPIKILGEPAGITFTPGSQMAYTITLSPPVVVPIRVATGTALPPITLGHDVQPYDLAITPGGKRAYVVATIDGPLGLVPIDLATGTVLQPIKTGSKLVSLGIAPDGRTAYALRGDLNSAHRPPDTVTFIRTASGKFSRPVTVIGWPQQIIFPP